MRDNASATAIEEALFTWGKGNTDYARAFFDFRELCWADLKPRSTLIVLGDARSNYYDPSAGGVRGTQPPREANLLAQS